MSVRAWTRKVVGVLGAAMLAVGAGSGPVPGMVSGAWAGGAAEPEPMQERVVPPQHATRPAGGHFVSGGLSESQFTFGLDPRFALIPVGLLVVAAVFGALTLRAALADIRRSSTYRD